MKTKTHTTALFKKGSLLLLSALIFAACSKDKSAPTPPKAQTGKISLLVSSPGATE